MAKEEKIERFLEELLRLISLHGVEGFKISDLAKRAKVSRPWIYKMFGSQKKELAREAALYFGKRFTELEQFEDTSESREGVIASLQRRSEQLIKDTVRYPYIVTLYFNHVGTSDPIGLVVNEIESAYLKRLTEMVARSTKVDPETATRKAKLLLVTRMGLVYSWIRKSKSVSISDEAIRRDLNYSVECILRD